MTAPTNFAQVGESFVKFYYEQFLADRSALTAVYRNESMLSWEDKKVQGSEAIIAKLKEIPATVKFQLITVDCQPSVNGGVLVFVLGDLSIDNGPPMKFTHIFHLQKTPEGNFFVFNEMFRLSIG